MWKQVCCSNSVECHVSEHLIKTSQLLFNHCPSSLLSPWSWCAPDWLLFGVFVFCCTLFILPIVILPFTPLIRLLEFQSGVSLGNVFGSQNLVFLLVCFLQLSSCIKNLIHSFKPMKSVLNWENF